MPEPTAVTADDQPEIAPQLSENEEPEGQTEQNDDTEKVEGSGEVSSGKETNEESDSNQEAEPTDVEEISQTKEVENGNDSEEPNQEEGGDIEQRKLSAISRSNSKASNNGSSRPPSRSSVPSPSQYKQKFKVTLLYPLEKQYACPVCHDVLRYPVQFDQCSHRVCFACFHDIARVEPRCPVDQAHFNKDKIILDKEFNKEIQALEVKCNNHEWGCKWEGEFKEVLAHNEICEYEDILCINDCGAKFQKRFQQKHLDKDCPKRIIPCAYCDDRHLREDKKKHLEECPKVPLPCPNKCDKKLSFPRDELDKHIEQDCPRTKIMCQFEDIGCSHRSSRDKLQKHYKTGIIEHVQLIYDLVMQQGKRLDNHDAQLQDHLNLLENHQERIADMERISRNQLIWKIEDYTRKLKEAKAGNTTTIFSPTFTTTKHGYRLCASVCLNGDGKGKGTHISVFISVLKGAYDALLKWPFDYRVTFLLLDQNEDAENRKHIKFSIKPNPCAENEPFLGRPKLEKNASFGGAKFAKHEEIENRNYVKDDTVFLKITVDCDGSTEP